MPNKGIHKGFNRDIPGGSSGPQDVLARIRTGQSLDDVEPRSACLPEPPPMTSKLEIWDGALSIELPAAAAPPAIMPTPAYAIGQTVLFANLKQLTFLTERSIPPPRRVWLYKFIECDAWVPEAYFEPVAQDIPFDDFIQGSGDWIPLTFVRDVLERKPEDESLPLAV